jgi:rhodanese-related sulfurtransferase
MSIKTISPSELKLLLDQGAAIDLIDVRTPLEYAEMHALPARLVWLDQLDPRAIIDARIGRRDEPIYLICRSGSRGAKACEKFLAAGFENAVNVEGGTLAWERAGLPVVRGRKVISLERQVRIVAGALALIGAILGWLVHPALFALCGLVGAGLIFAGVTDFCGMGLLLARMPWNPRSNSITQQETGASCQA